MNDHRFGGAADVFFGIADAEFGGLRKRETLRDVAIERVVSARLVCDDINDNAAANDFREDLSAVADETDGEGAAFSAGSFTESKGFVEVFGEGVAVACVYATLNARTVHVDSKYNAIIERDGEWLRAAHAANAASDDEFALERASKVAVSERGEGLEGSLQNALSANVYPTSGGHLAIHDEALAIKLVEVLPGSPFADEIGVGDENAWSEIVRGKDGNGFTRLDEESFFVAELLKLADDGVEGLPVTRGATDAAIDDQVGGTLGDFGVEVVHEAAECGLLLPTFAAELVSARGTDDGSFGEIHGASCAN